MKRRITICWAVVALAIGCSGGSKATSTSGGGEAIETGPWEVCSDGAPVGPLQAAETWAERLEGAEDRAAMLPEGPARQAVAAWKRAVVLRVWRGDDGASYRAVVAGKQEASEGEALLLELRPGSGDDAGWQVQVVGVSQPTALWPRI